MSDIAAAPKLAQEQKDREFAMGLWRLAKALKAEADAAFDVPHLDSFVKNSHIVNATMRAIPLLNVARAKHTEVQFKRVCLEQMRENTKGMLLSLSNLWCAIDKELKALGVTPQPDGVEWNFDPAASGPRLRAFLPGGELFAWADGRWAVCLNGGAVYSATGDEKTQALAQARALRVYEALTR